MKRSIHIPVILIICLFSSHCNIDQSIPFTNEAIFKNAEYIRVPYYTYTDSHTNRTYIFHGTSDDDITIEGDFQDQTYVVPYDHFDTVSSRPSFVWERTDSKYVMVAVFSERVAIDNAKNQIINDDAIVWAWNTGMGTGREGTIGYLDGCSVIDGEIQYGIDPDPLVQGATYLLAIWAWDQRADEVRYSSREIPFVVEN